MSRHLTPLFALLALAGCETSSDDVVLTVPGSEASPESLSVAWEEMEARLGALEGELAATRRDLASLCADPATSVVSRQALCARVATVEGRVGGLVPAVEAPAGAVVQLIPRVDETESTLAPFHYDPEARAVYFTGVDLHLRNATGSTGGDPDGTGNLVIGWNEADEADTRTGSHNLVVGALHGWDGHSGLLVGADHALLGDGGAAIGGDANVVDGEGAVVIGGQETFASGFGAVAIGGSDVEVTGDLAVAVGGVGNDVPGRLAVLIGGAGLELAFDGAAEVIPDIVFDGDVPPEPEPEPDAQ